jgi:hypothetical protein
MNVTSSPEREASVIVVAPQRMARTSAPAVGRWNWTWRSGAGSALVTVKRRAGNCTH